MNTVESKFLRSELSPTTPLQTLNIELDLPSNWEGIIVKARSLYLSQRREEMRPRNLNETLQAVEQIIQLEVPEVPDELVPAVGWNTVGLMEIYVLLLDPEVSEIMASNLGLPLVITHRVHGRCKTNILFTEELWKSLKSRAEFDTGETLSPISPALKAGFETEIGSIRVSMQMPPLAVDGPAFSIRRLPVVTISMERLIRDEQVTKGQAEYLLEKVTSRANIVIAGEPGSGKTTLANALLMETDPTWRLIIIEDAKEVRFDNERFPLLTRFSMPSVGSDKRYAQRANEIARLLHRSPDYVFLGEIQNKEDTVAAMEAFAAGIRGMATTHGHNLDGLLARWELSHGMSHDLLQVIDIVVITKRRIVDGRSELRVEGIYSLVLKDGRFNGFEQVEV